MTNDTKGSTPNRIWIELDKATSQEHGDRQCDLANRMLARLGDTGGQGFFYDHGRGYSYGGPMGSEGLADRGKWFNLDYLAGGPDAVTHKVATDALAILKRILYAHDTGNCGASSGEAILCRQYAFIARDVLARATLGTGSAISEPAQGVEQEAELPREKADA